VQGTACGTFIQSKIDLKQSRAGLGWRRSKKAVLFWKKRTKNLFYYGLEVITRPGTSKRSTRAFPQRGGRTKTEPHRAIGKKFFGSFFKKELLSSLSPSLQRGGEGAKTPLAFA
jgi:hypothetical protein